MVLADLEHLRVVKHERHQKWAADHGMTHHAVSAKTGESVFLNVHLSFLHVQPLSRTILYFLLDFQVNLVFQKVAAEILGIKLYRHDLESNQRVLKAEITTYKKVEAASKPVTGNQKSSFCSLQ